MGRRLVVGGGIAVLAAAGIAVGLAVGLGGGSGTPSRAAGTSSTQLALTSTTSTPTTTTTTTTVPQPTLSVSAVQLVSEPCQGRSAEVENAVSPSGRDVYEDWIGCDGIGFARSTDGGLTFGPALLLPGSRNGLPAALGQRTFSWDPAITVAPDGTIYASFMLDDHDRMYPVVDISHDGGVTFESSPLEPSRPQNFGDRDFVAADGHGHVWVTWDYAPTKALVQSTCFSGGSCGFDAGDLNAVVQESPDGGRTWGPIVPVGPGYPRNGGDSAPLVVDPSGHVDVVYQGYTVTGTSDRLGTAREWFASSPGPGKPWTPPSALGTPAMSMTHTSWWIDGDIASDAAGDLYVTWDSQSAAGDIGWIAWSTDHGRTWSSPVRVTPDVDGAAHIVQVAGGATGGAAYVAWLTDAPLAGYTLYLRPFSISRGWLSRPLRVSVPPGRRSIWPGDTFGISRLPAPAGTARLALTWGSAIGGPQGLAEIYAGVATLTG